MQITSIQIRDIEIEYERILKTAKSKGRKPMWTRTEYIAHRVNCMFGVKGKQ